MPSAASRLLMVAGWMRPWKRVSRATSGPPGSNRGRMKLSVSAAQSVTTKNSRRRTRYRTPATSLRLVHPQQGLLPIGDVPGRRGGVGIVLGRPAGEALRAVLVPRYALRHRDDGHLLQHDPLDLLHDLVLLTAVGGAAKILDQLIGRRVGPALVVAGCRLSNCGRGLAVQGVAELVVGIRPGRGRQRSIRQLKLTVEQLVEIVVVRQILLLDLDADLLQVVLHHLQGGSPVGVAGDYEHGKRQI